PPSTSSRAGSACSCATRRRRCSSGRARRTACGRADRTWSPTPAGSPRCFWFCRGWASTTSCRLPHESRGIPRPFAAPDLCAAARQEVFRGNEAVGVGEIEHGLLAGADDRPGFPELDARAPTDDTVGAGREV